MSRPKVTLYLLWTYIHIILQRKSVEGAVLGVQQSNDLEAINGSTVEITCSTNSASVDWYILNDTLLDVSDSSATQCFIGTFCSPPTFTLSTKAYTFTTVNTSQTTAQIPEVTIDDERWWHCADTTDISDSKMFLLSVVVPVTSISMSNAGARNVTAGQPFTITCVTSYCKPAAEIKLIKELNGNRTAVSDNITSQYDVNGITTGTYDFTPTSDDEGASFLCEANNSITVAAVSSPGQITISVVQAHSTSTASPGSPGSTGTTTTAEPTTTTETTTTTTSTTSVTTTSATTTTSSTSATATSTTAGATTATSSVTSSQTTVDTSSIRPTDKTTNDNEIVLIVVCSSIGGIFVISVVACVLWNFTRGKSKCHPSKEKLKHTNLHHFGPSHKHVTGRHLHGQNKPNTMNSKSRDHNNYAPKQSLFEYRMPNTNQQDFSDHGYQVYDNRGWQRPEYNYNRTQHKYGEQNPQQQSNRSMHPRSIHDYRPAVVRNPVYTEYPTSHSEIGYRDGYYIASSRKQNSGIKPHYNQTMYY